jgi:hypothetical protein
MKSNLERGETAVPKNKSLILFPDSGLRPHKTTKWFSFRDYGERYFK